MPNVNQTPEQVARDNIDRMLSHAGWVVQDKKKIDFSVGLGIAVREYQTDVGPAANLWLPESVGGELVRRGAWVWLGDLHTRRRQLCADSGP